MTTIAGCSICSESLTKEHRVRKAPGTGFATHLEVVNVKVTPCGHAFHAYCISYWMKKEAGPHGSCPICRKEIRGKRCAALFLDEIDSSELELAVLANFKESTDKLTAQLTAAKEARRISDDQVAELTANLATARNDNVALGRRLETVSNKGGEISVCFDHVSIGSHQEEIDMTQENADSAEARFKIVENKLQEAINRAEEAENRLEFLKISAQADKMATEALFKNIESRLKNAEFRADDAESRLQNLLVRYQAAEEEMKNAEAREKHAKIEAAAAKFGAKKYENRIVFPRRRTYY